MVDEDKLLCVAMDDTVNTGGLSLTTYEARMRGFDVEVVPNDKAHPMCSRLARDSTLMWQNEDGSPATYLFGTGRWESKSNWVGPLPNARRFETKLQETLSEDARYTLGFKWRGFNSGHIVMLEKDGPDLVIYDPQSNRLYRGSYASSYLDRIAYSRSVYGSNYYKWPEVMRVDDKRRRRNGKRAESETRRISINT